MLLFQLPWFAARRSWMQVTLPGDATLSDRGKDGPFSSCISGEVQHLTRAGPGAMMECALQRAMLTAADTDIDHRKQY